MQDHLHFTAFFDVERIFAEGKQLNDCWPHMVVIRTPGNIKQTAHQVSPNPEMMSNNFCDKITVLGEFPLLTTPYDNNFTTLQWKRDALFIIYLFRPISDANDKGKSYAKVFQKFNSLVFTISNCNIKLNPIYGGL